MTNESPDTPSVRALAAAAGLDLEEGDDSLVRAALEGLLAFGRELLDIDVSEVPSSLRFTPGWPR